MDFARRKSDRRMTFDLTDFTVHTHTRFSVYYAFTAAQGQPLGGSQTMQMPMMSSALGRGIQRIAGMIAAKAGQDARNRHKAASEFHLVSWQPGARSRREDEMARARQQILTMTVES